MPKSTNIRAQSVRNTELNDFHNPVLLLQENWIKKIEAELKRKFPDMEFDRDLLKLVGALPYRNPASKDKELIAKAIAEKYDEQDPYSWMPISLLTFCKSAQVGRAAWPLLLPYTQRD